MRKPVASYVEQIVKKWHVKLCQDCFAFGQCLSPGDCLKKKKSYHLCSSCDGWFKKLVASHRNNDKSQIKWRQNCDTSKWPVDAWEVAKFFMSTLGDNKSTVTNAESTDLSSLLNVLEWMKDVAFGGDRRVDLNLVKRLRSEVRNAWAHSPRQEMTDVELNNAFEIAEKFLDDLNAVFSHVDTQKCVDDIQFLKANGLINVAETELENLVMLRKELPGDVIQIKDKIETLKRDRNFDHEIIQKILNTLKNLEEVAVACCSKMNDFSREFLDQRENLDDLFRNITLEMVSLREQICQIRDNICQNRDDICQNRFEISQNRARIKELQDAKNARESEWLKPKSCLPETLPTFSGRDAEINKIISFVMDKEVGVVTAVGGPGFGKSTIAVEVSHRLCEKHDITVIFSYLSNASCRAEVIRRLCLDVGVQADGENSESSLIFWSKNIEKKVVLVMDNIEQLLEGETRSQFVDLIQELRKNSNQRLQIIATSRTVFSIDNLTTENVSVEEMGDDTSVELLRKRCGDRNLEDDFLYKLAKLCGHVPLALCIAASRIQDFDDPNELVTWLKEELMDVLQDPERNLSVCEVIERSFEKMSDEDKKALVRLSVFNGNFNRSAAQEIIKKDGLETQNFLKYLVSRSLIQSRDGRFCIHSLVRRFLTDREELRGEMVNAQERMVSHFLDKCQRLTHKYWSRDGFNAARKGLTEDLHNIEEILRICEQACDERTLNSVIVDTLVKSDIYQSSSRFFYNFILHVLSLTLVKNFLDCCVKLAKQQEDVVAILNYQCLLADAKGRESQWKSSEYTNDMKSVMQTFNENEDKLQKENGLKSHFYYCYGRYLGNQETNSNEDHLLLAKCYLQSSFDSRKIPGNNPFKEVDQVVTLHQLGRLNKMKDEEALAEEKFQMAIELSEKSLGDHELTSSSYKKLGDLYFKWKKKVEALNCYDKASEIHERLELSNCSISSLTLLKNRGSCLSRLNRAEEAVRILDEAYYLMEKFPENYIQGKFKSQLYYLRKTARDRLGRDCQELAE